MTPRPDTGTVLAFDFGLRRIGVAVGECGPGTASALATISAHDGEPDWAALDALLAEWRPVALVAGLPHHRDGTESDLAPAVRAFAAALGRRSGHEVELIDESLSSRAAREELRTKRRSGMLRRRVRRGDADAIAARLILESWMNRSR